MYLYLEPITGQWMPAAKIFELYAIAILCGGPLLYAFYIALRDTFRNASDESDLRDPEEYQKDAARFRAQSDYLDAKAQHTASQAAYNDLEKYLKRRK
jgi:hypothetical protein